MTRSELLGVIRAVLSETMALPQLSELGEDARLQDQVGLDSVRVLELLVHLELEHGLTLPEAAALERQDGTLGALADFLVQHRSALAAEEAGGPT